MKKCFQKTSRVLVKDLLKRKRHWEKQHRNPKKNCVQQKKKVVLLKEKKRERELISVPAEITIFISGEVCEMTFS